MAIDRVVDPTRFILLGGITEWSTAYRRQLGQEGGHARALPPAELAAERGLESTAVLQLRWVVDPALGYPTEPFTVWRREAGERPEEEEIKHNTYLLVANTVVTFFRPYVWVRVRVQAGVPGSLLAYGGAPFESRLVDERTTTATGELSFTVAGPAIQSLVLPLGWTVRELYGLDDRTAEDPAWEPIEYVGLPTDGDWAGVQQHDRPQGPLSNLLDPRDAALDRFRRGAPFYGWDPTLEPGVAAPPWVLADPKAMLEVTTKHVLPPLRDMLLSLPAERHREYEVSHQLLAAAGRNPATAAFKPLPTLAYGASTDGLASLITGFGTAYAEKLGRGALVSGRGSRFDYLVTARYDNGTVGSPDPVEYAAMVFTPGLASAPPAPAGLAAASDGLRAPATTDADWTGVTRVTWSKLPDTMPFRIGSYAFVRHQVAPAGGVEPVMDRRPLDSALQEIGVTTSRTVPPVHRYTALDERYGLTAVPTPNSLSYGLAHLDLFGLYSTWSTVPFEIGEPPVRRVDLITGRIDSRAPDSPGAPCPASLTLEFAWDWAARSPRRIDVAGRMYAQARLGDPPANLAVPGGLPASLGGGPGALLSIDVAGDGSATLSSVTAGLSARLFHLSLDGKSLEPGPLANAGPRRYRLVVDGFALDHDAAGRIGLALWARGTEARWPGRVGPWSGRPLVASAADPRPPIVVNTREFVQLASLADASGEHHALLEWPNVGGAVSYFVYSVAEASFLADRGLPEAPRSATLADRLVRLRTAFAADPSRRSFSRLNAEPVAAHPSGTTRMPIVLPRGTKELHLFVVLGLSAGQIESEWPALGSPGLRMRFVAFAAPQIVVPTAPELEVVRVLDESVSPPAYRARIRARTGAGARVSRVDLHRVRVPEAAIEVDSMGPAIAHISGSTAPFSVTPTVSSEVGVAQPIGTIRGNDAVPGSWRTVYYRAIAWSGDDAERGLYGGRSPSSALRSVVVPPAEPPELAAPAATPLDPAQPPVRIDLSTLAPVEPTPLGPHRITAEVTAVHADGTAETLLVHPPAAVAPAPAPAPAVARDADRLDLVPLVTPAGGGLSRDPSEPALVAGGPQRTPLHLVVPRLSFDDALVVRVRLVDPLGRLTERVLEVPAGAPEPPPDITAPSVQRIAGRGTVLQFTTAVPDTDALGRPAILRITLSPGPAFPPRRPVVFASALADVAPLLPGDDPFADPAPIPVRRQPSGRVTSIGAVLRGSGRLTVTLTTADGRSASFRAVLP